MKRQMFGKHVTKFLSAYCHGELSAAERAQVTTHLQVCQRCQQEYEAIALGAQLAGHLQPVAAPATLRLAQSETAVKPARFSWRHMKFAVAMATVILLAVGGWWSLRPHRQPERDLATKPAVLETPYASVPSPHPSLTSIAPPAPPSIPTKPPTGTVTGKKKNSVLAWEVENVTGTPRIGDAQIAETGRLGVGEWLETDNASKAKIKVAEIGYVDIDPNSRVRLVETKDTEHRIALAKGKMSAMILAPPRLFVVDTPSAKAVDLGCAYTLEVDELGASLLHVTSGWVSFVRDGRESFIPAGAMCATRKGQGVGTPYFFDASERFKSVLTEVDFGNKMRVEKAVAVLLTEARTQDALTLWHLLGRQGNDLSIEMRGKIYDRLVELVPPPANVTRVGVLRYDQKMLETWWEERIR